MNIKYNYTERNLLEEPENYFFSEYNGNNFVKAYFENRLNKIGNLKSNSCFIYTNIQEYLERNKTNYDIEIETSIISVSLLRCLLKEIISNNIRDKKKYFDMFIKKYEVTKKIYNEYSNDFKAITSGYNQMENYCLLSICCSICYKQTKNLKYINTAMKINDMLCSKGITVEGDNVFLLYTALNEEVSCINELFLGEGFSYDIN